MFPLPSMCSELIVADVIGFIERASSSNSARPLTGRDDDSNSTASSVYSLTQAVASGAVRAAVTRRSASLIWLVSKGSGARRICPDVQAASPVNNKIPRNLKANIQSPNSQVSPMVHPTHVREADVCAPAAEKTDSRRETRMADSTLVTGGSRPKVAVRNASFPEPRRPQPVSPGSLQIDRLPIATHE